MYVAGAYITITGGAGAMTGLAPDIGLPWDLKYGEANSPWEARQKVRTLAGQNVNVIKVLVTGAILTHNSNHLAREFTYEELAAIVDEANNFGLKVAAHGHNVNGIKNAVRAGVSSIEHGSFLDDEVITMMKQKGTYLVPTLEVHSCIQTNAALPKDFLMHDSVAVIHMQSFSKAVKAGVKIAYGTDNAVCGFRFPGREFELMVKYGMTPMQALQSATVAAADLLGQSKNARLRQGGEIRGHRRRERRSHQGYRDHAECRVRDERRRRIQRTVGKSEKNYGLRRETLEVVERSAVEEDGRRIHSSALTSTASNVSRRSS